MLNITSRLAVQLRHLPSFAFDWNDTQPQRSRQSLTISDFLPNEEDAQELKTRATHYIAHFLVQQFHSLSDLKEFVPEQQVLHPVTKSVVVPMKAPFKDEKYIHETIDILSTLMADADLKGSSQVRINTGGAGPTVTTLFNAHIVFTCTCVGTDGCSRSANLQEHPGKQVLEAARD